MVGLPRQSMYTRNIYTRETIQVNLCKLEKSM